MPPVNRSLDTEAFLAAYQRRRPDVVALATLASLARHIEPTLLRALRLAFAGPDCPMTVATESGLWFSPLVESRGASGITLQAEYNQVLRERLAQCPHQRLKKARRIIEECHSAYPDVLRWEEGIVYLALSGQTSQLDGEFYRGIKSLEGGTRPALERWIIDMVKRLPPAAADHPALIQLNNLAGGLSLQRATGQSESAVALDFSRVPKRQLGVIGINRSFRIGDVAEAKYGIDVPNIPPYTLDVIAPHQLAAEQPTITVQPDGFVELDARYGPVRLRTLDGQVYALEPSLFFPQKLRIFISYSHQDEAWKDRVIQHLGVLAQLEIWDDRRIQADDNWLPAIETALADCQAALLLVSAAFLTSDFILKSEIPALLERRAKAGLLVIPVILKPCLWTVIPWLNAIQGHPRDGKPLSSLHKHEANQALVDLAQKILSPTLLKKDSHLSRLARGTDGVNRVPFIAPTRLKHGAAHLFGREAELQQLDETLSNPAIRIITVVAWGGTGKTSLAVEWLNRLAAQGWPGLRRVFDWSFYSQGSREASAASSDAFLAAALQFFGDAEMANSPASAWDKGVRLAALIAQEPTLLLLDGLESLQQPPGPLAGQLKAPALQALLKALARSNPGLCLITTRESIADLAPYRETAAPELPLQSLAENAGVALLRSLGVKGSDSEYRQLVQDVNGHALSLNLLGHYLAQAHNGDIRRRDRVKLDKADAAIQGGHAFKAIAAYDTWLEQGGTPGHRQRALLRLLGLFDRPADAGCLAALRKQPTIAGLTEDLQDLEEDDWNLAVNVLRTCGLLQGGENSTLDAHPLIREYYAKQLREHHPEAFRLGHQRLFRHLCASTPDKPQPTLAELQPLYQAVAHGCLAGLHEEALAKVYNERILRGTGNDGFYSTNKLGAFASDLSAIAYFFEQPWRRPAAALSPANQAWLLAIAAFDLRALGRLREALEPMEAGLARRVEQENWRNAAISSGSLSELRLLLGDVAAARQAAQRALDYAERSSDAFWRMGNRSILADALQQASQVEEAEALFRQAEAMQKERQPAYPLLYSLQGFRYCELLLAPAERAAWRIAVGLRLTPNPTYAAAHDPEAALAVCRAVTLRVEQTLRWEEENNFSLLDTALDHLTLSRAALYAALLGEEPSAETLQLAQRHGDAAVNGLRQAGQQDYLPRGLLTRAWLRAVQGHPMEAQMDLAEAQDIAERGPMPLFLADVHLHRARLFSDKTELARAAALISQHGYARRAEELADAQRWLA